jgi:hypothetical protein
MKRLEKMCLLVVNTFVCQLLRIGDPRKSLVLLTTFLPAPRRGAENLGGITTDICPTLGGTKIYPALLDTFCLRSCGSLTFDSVTVR